MILLHCNLYALCTAILIVQHTLPINFFFLLGIRERYCQSFGFFFICYFIFHYIELDVNGARLWLELYSHFSSKMSLLSTLSRQILLDQTRIFSVGLFIAIPPLIVVLPDHFFVNNWILKQHISIRIWRISIAILFSPKTVGPNNVHFFRLCKWLNLWKRTHPVFFIVSYRTLYRVFKKTATFQMKFIFVEYDFFRKLFQ